MVTGKNPVQTNRNGGHREHDASRYHERVAYSRQIKSGLDWDRAPNRNAVRAPEQRTDAVLQCAQLFENAKRACVTRKENCRAITG